MRVRGSPEPFGVGQAQAVGPAVEQQIRFCRTADHVTLAYALAGRGPPLVKAANWLSHLEYDWRSPIWRPLLERLAARNTVIRYDERGCGLSDRDVDDQSFEAWLSDLEAVVDAAGPERFPLLGISQGAPIAIEYAVRHPERVSRLVLYGGFLQGRLCREPTRIDLEELEALVRLVRIGWGRSNPAYRQIFTTQFMPDADLEHVRAFTELQRVTASPSTAATILEAFERIDVRAAASRVRVPTLVLHARHDARVPFERGRELAALIPGARFIPLDGRNHVLLPMDPAFEPCLDAVHGFLAEDDGGILPIRARSPLLDSLTTRERDVIELLARGLSNHAIADRLCLSEKTIRNHVSRLFTKLAVRTRAEAVVLARENGFGHGS